MRSSIYFFQNQCAFFYRCKFFHYFGKTTIDTFILIFRFYKRSTAVYTDSVCSYYYLSFHCLLYLLRNNQILSQKFYFSAFGSFCFHFSLPVSSIPLSLFPPHKRWIFIHSLLMLTYSLRLKSNTVEPTLQVSSVS